MQIKSKIVFLLLVGVASIYMFFFYDTIAQLSVFFEKNQRYGYYSIGTIVLLYAVYTWQQKIWKKTKIVVASSHSMIRCYFFGIYILGISLPIVILLIVLFAVLIWGITINLWYRIFVIVPMSIAIFCCILLLILPTYKNIPHPEGFYDLFGTKLHVVIQDMPLTLGSFSGDIIISTQSPEQYIYIPITETADQFRTYTISKESTIIFQATMPLYNTFGFVQGYDGNIVVLPTQSSLTIQYTQTGYRTSITGIQTDAIIDKSQQFIQRQGDFFREQYRKQQREYMIQGVGGPWTQHPIINNIVAMTLGLLKDIFPKYYQDNYNNYQQFMLLIDHQPKKSNMTQGNTWQFVTDIVRAGLKQSRLLQSVFKR